MKFDKRHWRKGRRFLQGLRNDAGYVLPWVLIMALVAGVIMGPFLTFMLGGVRASYSYADTMAEYYAADSGIEDAIYRIQSEYSATTQIDGDIDGNDDPITVVSTSTFPESGVIQIEAELIYYTGKTGTEFSGLTRGYGSSTASSHDDGILVVADLPESSDVGDSWQYSIEDVNDKQVDVTIESLWLLDDLEDPSKGTLPHAELVLVGQVLDTPATILSGDIDDDDGTISVLSITAFPEASDDDPSIIRIEDELIRYTGKNANQFIGCVRGVSGTTAADHDQDTAVTSDEVTYNVDISYDNSLGNLKIDKVGVWLPAGFSYVPGSSNVATELDSPIFDTATNIPVTSTDLFPDSGVIAIEHELIQYDSKDSDTFEDCTRGYNGTTAVDHLSVGTAVSAEPQQSGYHGGIAVFWEFDNINFEDLPYEVPGGGEGGFTPSVEFPIRRTLTFSFSPAGEPKGIFSWVRTNRTDIYLSWDTSSGVYKITSTATDPSTSTHTTLESYVGKCKLTGRVSDIYGDARAIGNSLMKHLTGSDLIRETLLDESSATVSDIPDDAEVETAYLYWSAWKLSPDYDEDDIQQLAELVDEAEFNGAPITADRIQILKNQYGWSYSCFKDVASYLEPEQSADILISPVPGATQSVPVEGLDPGSRLKVFAPDSNLDNLLLDCSPDIVPPNTETDNISIGSNTMVITSGTSGSAEETYNATVTSTRSRLLVEGVTVFDGESFNITPLVTAAGSGPMATITKIGGTSASITVTNNTPNDPADLDNNITVDGDILAPGITDSYGPYLTDTPHTILGVADDRDYEVTIACTDGMVTVDYGSSSVVLGEPGTVMTNGTYTVGNVEADAGQEGTTSGQWAYAGWSLIIMYSSPSEEAHQLYLYDNFLYADQYTTHTFTVTGFLAPSDSEGVLTCFVGEGDSHYDDDYIKFNDNYLSNAVNPWNNVWNGQSSGLGGEEIDGVDIDTFDVEDYIDEGDTSAVIKLGTDIEIWNVVYLFISFRSDLVSESGLSPVGVITYGGG